MDDECASSNMQGTRASSCCGSGHGEALPRYYRRYYRGWYGGPMAVKKISVALDPDVADAAATVAEAAGQSLSSWLNDAARQHLRVQQGLAAVREWEQEHGTLTDEERAAAQATLDALSSRPGRRSA